MKKIKKIFSAATLSLLLIPSLTAFAGSHDNYGFSFTMGATNFTQYTTSRVKNETTPIYCRVDEAKLNTKSVKLAAVRGDYKESKYTPVTYVYRPGTYYLSSYIREDFNSGRSSISTARIRCQKYETFGFADISGVWSPDSYR